MQVSRSHTHYTIRKRVHYSVAWWLVLMITYDHFYTISREYAAFILSRAMNVSKWTSLTLNLNVLMVISFFFFFFFLWYVFLKWVLINCILIFLSFTLTTVLYVFSLFVSVSTWTWICVPYAYLRDIALISSSHMASQYRWLSLSIVYNCMTLYLL